MIGEAMLTLTSPGIYKASEVIWRRRVTIPVGVETSDLSHEELSFVFFTHETMDSVNYSFQQIDLATGRSTTLWKIEDPATRPVAQSTFLQTFHFTGDASEGALLEVVVTWTPSGAGKPSIRQAPYVFYVWLGPTGADQERP
jgi:hypothetical protein